MNNPLSFIDSIMEQSSQQQQDKTHNNNNNNKQDKKWKNSLHINDGLSQYYGRDCMTSSSSRRSNTTSSTLSSSSSSWPNGAKVAINFCIHLEEGSEECILHGDDNDALHNSNSSGSGMFFVMQYI